MSPRKPPLSPFGVQSPERGSSPVPSAAVYAAWARAIVSTAVRVAGSRSAHSRRAASTKYDWNVVSQNRVLPHSDPPARMLLAAKCRIVSTVCACSTDFSTPVLSAS
ncbi:hypothetical protein [Saccharothrix deserti]|uniref:hypothetical protein n=1 Tax=Saccharothrix deserti TaxID=2593674 RepID=UPI001EE47558|nr:hypothetical protein [Saccharothrix deserti]